MRSNSGDVPLKNVGIRLDAVVACAAYPTPARPILAILKERLCIWRTPGKTAQSGEFRPQWPPCIAPVSDVSTRRLPGPQQFAEAFAIFGA